ncbi:MAG: DUF5011 domain-containing protein, partial [Clostridia bacterium]|nr:DUF5011 domain-containing protein [Clostridia bacterium]
MSSFIKNQKQKIIVMIITIIMMTTGISIFALATENQAPEVVVNVKAGRIKAGSEISFTVTDETGINNVYYMWDRRIDKKSNTEKEAQYVANGPTEHTFTFTVPFSDDLGLHEISIAAKDIKGKLTTWINVPYYVVNEDVPEDYVDETRPTVIQNIPDDYPSDGSEIEQGRKIKIKMEDENDIYWIAYKWSNTNTYDSDDYVTNSIVAYKPGNEFIFTAPDELGEWYLQYYMVDGADNVTKGYCSHYYVVDKVAPVLTLNGLEAMDVNLNDTFEDPGATWTDNVDGEGIVYANEQLDTSKPGPQTLTYTYTDKNGNISNTVSRVVTVVAPQATYELKVPTKSEYLVGEEIDLTGAEIKVIGTRGEVSYITPTAEMFGGFSTTTEGSFVAIFKYETDNVVHASVNYNYTVAVPFTKATKEELIGTLIATDYTTESWTVFETAIDIALEKETKSEYEAAITDVDTARGQLVAKDIDMSALTTIEAELGKLIESDYTIESYKAITDAIAVAKEIKLQSAFDVAVAAIDLNNLVAKDVDTSEVDTFVASKVETDYTNWTEFMEVVNSVKAETLQSKFDSRVSEVTGFNLTAKTVDTSVVDTFVSSKVETDYTNWTEFMEVVNSVKAETLQSKFDSRVSEVTGFNLTAKT